MACQQLTGDSAAYAGGAMGGIMMLGLAVGTSMVVARGGKLRGPGLSDQGRRWKGLFFVSLVLVTWGVAVQGASALFSGSQLASGSGFHTVDFTKYGSKGTVASAGLTGGSAFVAFFVSIASLIDCLRHHQARLLSKTTPLLVLAWTLYLLAIAVVNFGTVHMMTLDTNNRVTCRDNYNSSNKARGGIAGFLGLLSWLIAISAAIVEHMRSKVDSVGAGASDANVAQERTRKWVTNAFCAGVGGVYLNLCCLNFASVQSKPSSSATKAALIIPGLWYFFTSFALVFSVILLRKNFVATIARGKETGMHKVCFLLTLGLTMFSFACNNFLQASQVQASNPKFNTSAGLYGFLAFVQAMAFVVALIPVMLRTHTCVQLRTTHSLLPCKKGEKPDAASDSAYDDPWNLFGGWWVIIMFITMCDYSYLSALHHAADGRLSLPKPDPVGGITGFAALIGVVLVAWAAISAAQGKAQDADSEIVASSGSMASADGNQSSVPSQAHTAAATPPMPAPRYDAMTGKPL